MPPRPLLSVALAAALLVAGCLGGIENPLDEASDAGDGAGEAAPTGLVPQSASTCDTSIAEGVYAREPDVAADPSDRSRLAAGLMVEIPSTAEADPVGESDEPVWMGLARSSDGGESWDYVTLSGYPGDPDGALSPFAGSAIVGDPVVEFLPDGTLLLMGLMVRADSSTTLWTARYPDGAMEPAEVNVVARGALPVPGGSEVPTPYQVAYNDKPYMTVDQETGAVHAAWSWRGNVQGSRAIPMYAQSTDGGRTWSTPQPLVDADATYAAGDAFHVGAYPVVADDGSVHVFWWESRSGTLLHALSTDGGETFTDPESLGPAEGGLGGTGGVLAGGLPQAGVDRSGGPHDGSMYVAWASGDDGDWDVQVRTSHDDGRTWEDPVPVHPDDGASHQVQPALAVGPDGSLSVLHLEVHDDAEELYEPILSRSDDGGDTFTTTALAGEPSDGEAAADVQPVGDYMGLDYDDEGPVAVWQDGRMGDPEDPYSEAFVCGLTDGS